MIYYINLIILLVAAFVFVNSFTSVVYPERATAKLALPSAPSSSTKLQISSAPSLPELISSNPITRVVTDISCTDNDTIGTLSSAYLIHKGRSVDMIKMHVPIEGLSLSIGWTPQATESFKLAIEAVVRANPILTGRLIEKKKTPWPWSRRSELWIAPNAFPPEIHSFLTEVKPPSDLPSPAELISDGVDDERSSQDLFKHVHTNLAPCILDKVSFTANQIEDGSPLFGAKLMDFGDGTAAYSIKMSHALGDGTTFFQIVSQISSFMNGREPSPIEWDNPLKSTHEIYPGTFSERDYQRSYGLPFGWGVLKNIRTLCKRKCEYMLISKDKIAQKKKELRNMETDGGAPISSNDIIMSALCEMCSSSDIFAFVKSVRGSKAGVSKMSAGNFVIEIPFEVKTGVDPFEIRKILSSDNGSYFGTNDVPLLPSLNGRVGRITSVASVAQHQTTFPGSELVCQFPSASYIEDLPLDVAVIFRFDKDHWGIMHNFRKVKHSKLLDEIVA